ncbi:hypothetical protein CY34DRAFT_801228 [Suillus luteus UH-Slu-Lm8-n1]|uniref:WD40 repeat-like protein n=1 Tax=Suillus luteus UH-Slu-Lm8-n1 TaxID=930992 RepID=A0A0D0BIA0_9AGAM|nr:hypothetical protein CY34DRAFT_801228 [Suillus luteus UH-Slu-Lm8-n1]
MSSSTSQMPAIMPHQTMQGHTKEVRGVVHLPGERQIITCSWDGSLRLWDLENGTQIGKDWRNGNDALWSMALSPNGQMIVTGSGIDYDIRLWDVEKRNMIIRCTGHTRVVWALCWSADGERVASGSWDGTARVWDVKRRKNILTIKTGHQWVWAVTYSPDSSKLATGGHNNSAVKIWDAKTGKRLNTLEHDWTAYSLAWTSDGKKLISGSYGPIKIFDTATWQQIGVLDGHTSSVNAISLSPNNRLLASASNDKTARLWNLDTNLPVGPPLQHQYYVDSTALSRNGKVLVTACRNNNAYSWDVHAILKEAGLEDLLLIGTNVAPKDRLKEKATDESGIQRTPRSSLDNKSFLDADATQCPGQCGGVDELPQAFFAGMAADVDVRNQYFDCLSSMDAHPHSSVNALLARLSSLLHCFRSDNGESTELPQPSRHLAFHIHALLARLSALIHSSPSENDAPDEHQQPSTPLWVDPRVLLARLSAFLHRSRLNTDEEAESHHTTPLSSRPDELITRLSSPFRSQPHTNEEIELAQRPSRPRVVDVAAVRDKQTLVVARGPNFMKALRAHLRQSQSHAQAQASSSHTQPTGASTSATHPAPGTAAAQPPPIRWWAHIVLFLCCTSPHANGL